MMKNKIKISIITFLILIAVVFVFVVFPAGKDIRNNYREFSEQRKNSTILSEKIAGLEKFKNLYKNLEKILKDIDNLFVDAEVPVEFVGFLEKSASQCGLKMEVYPLASGNNEKDFWPSANFQITSNSSFNGLLCFFGKIENGPYLAEVRNLTVSASVEDKKTGWNVKSIFLLKVFIK